MRCVVGGDDAEMVSVLVEKGRLATRLQNLEAGLQVDSRRALHESPRDGVEVRGAIRTLMLVEEKLRLRGRPRLVRNPPIRRVHDRPAGRRAPAGNANVLRAITFAVL